MSELFIRQHCIIRRPIDVVRAHFLDFDHHIENGVHKGVHYTVIERGPRQRIRQSFRVLGLPKTDELIAYCDDDGSVVNDLIKGDFAGGRIRVAFSKEGETATRVEATLSAKLRGINALLAPVVRRVAEKLTIQALEEDRVDLEERGYVPRASAL